MSTKLQRSSLVMRQVAEQAEFDFCEYDFKHGYCLLLKDGKSNGTASGWYVSIKLWTLAMSPLSMLMEMTSTGIPDGFPPWLR